MNPRTTVRLTVSSPTFGFFNKAIQVENDIYQEEQNLIDLAARELELLMLSWLHRGERQDAVDEAIMEICNAFHRNENAFHQPERSSK